ncbi:MAG: hypothetical protein H7Y38_05800 [Armatimonadetes bacterium]|nr:hypothetical protein [Armatimonadota bacterium]
MKMKIVLKPGGIFFLVGIVTLLIVSIMMSPRPRPASAPILPDAATVDAPVPTVNPVAPKASISLGGFQQAGDSTLGAFTSRTEALPGTAKPVAVNAVQTLKLPTNGWDVAAHVVVTEVLPAKASLRLVFWARSVKAGSFAAHHEETKSPYEKSLSQTIETTPEWKRFDLPFQTTRVYNANESQIAFHFGFAPGTIEVADIRLSQDKP